ncbi:MAG: 2-dehydropantoate 2-reductase, partial [Anaerolineales bacterium]|nr:2-dehydropantoate 2-reductase [Anaerolineales bacterium]
GIALTLQNGLGNRERLSRDLGAGRVALGITTTGATLLGPGLVKVGGEGIISLEQNPALAPIEAALRSSNFNLQIVADTRSLVWGKLVINAAINPLTALLRVPNGELLNHPWARKAMSALARETAQVAEAERVSLPFEDPIQAAEEVARKTAKNLSSMFQDVRRGAPTEIDAICGAVTKRGEQHGIETPYNRSCWQLVKSI